MTDHLTVLVCRDCCCGTVRKHPELDHDGQLRRLREAAERSGCGAVHVTGCMGQCSESNVIQLKRRRTVHGRRERETLWFGRVLDPELTELLSGWIEDGCPGPPPGPLVTGMFGPTSARYRHLDPTLG